MCPPCLPATGSVAGWTVAKAWEEPGVCGWVTRGVRTRVHSGVSLPSGSEREACRLQRLGQTSRASGSVK